jgi:CHAT domain
MTGYVLLFGSDLSWRDALQIGMETGGWSAVATHLVESAQNELRASGERCVAAVIAAFGNEQSNGPEVAIAICEGLRRVLSKLPIMFDISVPDYALTAYAIRCPPVRFFTSKQPDSIVPNLQALLNMRAENLPKQPPQFATFEVTCEAAAVTFSANLDQVDDPVGPYPVPWIEDRKLKQLDQDFETFRLMESDPSSGRRAAKEWSAKLKRAGSEISQALGLDSGAQAAVLAAFVKELKELEHVHYRFNLPRDRMKHIPFELVWDGNRERHLRELAPVARRVLLRADERINMPWERPEEATVTGRVLFIRSPARGALLLEGRQFDHNSTFTARELLFLSEEIKKLRQARKAAHLPEPVELRLSSHRNAVEEVLEKVADGPWDIVHFAGHSVCADDGEVFLLLPGSQGAVPMLVSDFAGAAYEGHVRLVILSSCESSSPDAVFRLAQAGIPAAIGFRWEVDDKEAAEFTGKLHRALANDEPVGRAFHKAVQFIKATHLTSPTFASPVLMVQDDMWAVPKARRSRGVRNGVVASPMGLGAAGAGESGRGTGTAAARQDGP